MREQCAERLVGQIGLAAVPHDGRVERDIVRRKRTAKQCHMPGSGIIGELNVRGKVEKEAEGGVGQQSIETGTRPIVAVDRPKERVDRVPVEAGSYVLQRNVASSHTVARHAGAPVAAKLAPDE